MLMSFSALPDPAGCRVVVGKKEMLFPDVSTDDLWKASVAYHEDGLLVQDAFPFLTDDQREFIMTGLTPEDWDQLFGEE